MAIHIMKLKAARCASIRTGDRSGADPSNAADIQELRNAVSPLP